SGARLGAVVALGLDLVDALAGARERRRDRGELVATVAATKKRQAKAAEALLRAMASFAGERDAQRSALSRARERFEKGGVDAVGALVRLAGDWLALSDDVSRHLADDAGLVPSLTHEATESARAFGHATAAHKKNGGSMRKGDPPEVNVIEGRVVFEMRAL